MTNEEIGKDLRATCNRCGFDANPDEFEPCLSPYHDLRCPECGSTDINHSYGSYKNNVLIMTDKKMNNDNN